MKNNQLIIAAVFGILFFGCSKTEQPSPEKAVRPQQIKLHTMAGMEFARPEVPVYLGDEAVESRGVTTVSPGTNQLQAIINNAANNETIRLLAGTHTEDATLVINHKVKLTGDAGAVLSLGGAFGVLVSGANGTTISNIEVLNAGGGIIGIAVENSSNVSITGNSFSGFTHSIALEQANHAKVTGNTIAGTGAGFGVTIINGDFVLVSGNDISANYFGIWACDKKGTAVNNNTHGNVIGIILCKVPADGFPLGNGNGGAEFSCNEWNVSNNTANGNFWGYLVIDGSFNNTLSNNTGSGNAIDMELAGDTNLAFGFFTPTSVGNTVNVGGSGMDVIDCGVDNVVHGTVPLAGPCTP
jgi:parallel beta-helix repeat protein